MAFPQFQSLTTTVFSSDVTSHNVGMPATVNAGDLLLCIFTNDGAATVTTPSGWTSKGTQLSSNSGVRQSVFAKIASGSEDGTTVDFVTSASESAAAQVYRVTESYQDTSTGVAVAASVDGGSEVSTPDPPNLSPGWGSVDTLWITSIGTSDSTATSVLSYPSGYSGGTYTTSGATTTDAQIASARKTAAASSDNPGIFTLNDTATYAAFTIGIRPRVLISKALSGSSTDAGSLTTFITRITTLTGTSANSGVLATFVNRIKALAGTSTNAGVLARLVKSAHGCCK